jgi:hypothetical protein
MDIIGIGCEDMDWIHLAHEDGPVIGSCEHKNEPPGEIKGRKFLD